MLRFFLLFYIVLLIALHIYRYPKNTVKWVSVVTPRPGSGLLGLWANGLHVFLVLSLAFVM